MKFYNIFWIILFAWIMIYGSTYASFKCSDIGYNLCNITSPFTSKSESFFSKCAKNSECTSTLSFSTDNDFCCQKKECSSEKNLYLNRQNSNTQIQPFFLVAIGQSCQSKDISLGTVFDQYRSAQPISIYVLIKSFLC